MHRRTGSRSPRHRLLAELDGVGADGTAAAAISITAWISRLEPDRLAPAVRTVALGVLRVLRSREPA
ncbi:MAG: hypothetical protein ACXWYP_04705 [Pseudonocardia sp.]